MRRRACRWPRCHRGDPAWHLHWVQHRVALVRVQPILGHWGMLAEGVHHRLNLLQFGDRGRALAEQAMDVAGLMSLELT